MNTGREYLQPSVGINNKLSEARHLHNEPFHSVKSLPAAAAAAEKIQLWKEPGPRLWHHRLCSLSHRRPGQQNRLLSDVSALAPTQAAILNQASHLAQKAFGARAREAETESNIYVLTHLYIVQKQQYFLNLDFILLIWFKKQKQKQNFQPTKFKTSRQLLLLLRISRPSYSV